MIPLFKPWITKSDIKAVIIALKKPQLTDGPILRKFETEFAKCVGARYAIGVSSGTASLHLSLLSIGVKPGDEVIVPDMTFCATANSVIMTGAKPILADIDDSLNISPLSLEKKISSKTRAIIPVHFAGYSCEMSSILKIAKKNRLKIIEDCAHSFGTIYRNKHVGNFGHVGCFSFYPTKNITTIEGGMIVTNSKKIAQQIELLRNHGMTRNLLQRDNNLQPWEYDVKTPGFNYRLDEIRSSLGLSQVKRFREIETRRITAAKYYNKKLKNVKGIEIVNLEKKRKHSYHMYLIKIKNDFGISRNKVHEKLFRKGIRTSVHYKPLHMYSYFKNLKLKNDEFPKSTVAYKELLTLPLFPAIKREHQDYVIENILKLKK